MTNTCNRSTISDLTLGELKSTYDQFARAMKGQVAYIKVSQNSYHFLRNRLETLNKSTAYSVPLVFEGWPVEVSDFVPDGMGVGFDLDGNIVKIFSFQEKNG